VSRETCLNRHPATHSASSKHLLLFDGEQPSKRSNVPLGGLIWGESGYSVREWKQDAKGVPTACVFETLPIVSVAPPSPTAWR
jgi:hypothetical protein